MPADKIENTPEGSGQEKLIIALDFGTTYSGVAYCFANQRDAKPTAVVNWPGAGGESAPKIPTVISYDKEDPTEFKWGASVDRQADHIVGVKLLLDPTQERPSYLAPGNFKKELKALPKSPIEVAGDFIGAMYQHALSETSKTVPKDYMVLCEKEYVLSVPAVWTDAAKHATLRAAEIAGISPVTLIKEPEAAALHTAKSLDFSIKPRDTFIVVDAGGGTVDLVSYEVEVVLPRLQVKELVPGTGGMAGSLGRNQRFASTIASLVGDEQWMPLKKSRAYYLAEKQFDREIKRAFRGILSETYFVNFPMAKLKDDPDSKLESSTWTMTGDDLKMIFDPIITDILRLIDHQVQSVNLKRGDSGVTGIFLVGGFGSSQYLKMRVQKAYPHVQVLQPNDAWAAIAKGAALSRLPSEALITSTSSTRHYGVEGRYDRKMPRDLGQPTDVDVRDGTLRTLCMRWYIGIGDDILRDQRIKFSFFRDIDHNYGASDLIFVDQLVECADTISPLHRSKGHRINVNYELTSNLSGILHSNLKKMRDVRGKPYWEVHYDLVITLESALMKFALEIDGKSMGSVEAKFH